MSKYFKLANSAIEGATTPEIPSLEAVLDGLQETLSGDPKPVTAVAAPVISPTAPKLKINCTDPRLLTPAHEGEFAYAVEATRALRTRILRIHATKGIKSFMLTSSVAGEGKT